MQRVEERRGVVPKSMQQANTSGGGRCQVCSIILRQRGCTVLAESGREERRARARTRLGLVLVVLVLVLGLVLVPKFRQQANTSGGGRCQVCSIT